MSIYLLPQLAQLSQKAVRRNGSPFFTTVQTKIEDQFVSSLQAAKTKIAQEAQTAATNATTPRVASAPHEASTAGEIFERVAKREINSREAAQQEAAEIAKRAGRAGSAPDEANAAGQVYDNYATYANRQAAVDAIEADAQAARRAHVDEEKDAAGHAYDNYATYADRQAAEDDAYIRARNGNRAGSAYDEIAAADTAYDKAILHRTEVSFNPKSTEKTGGEYYKVSIEPSTGKPVIAYLPQRRSRDADAYWTASWPLVERFAKAVKSPHGNIDPKYLVSGRKPQISEKKLDRRDAAVTFFDTPANARRVNNLNGQNIDVSLLPSDKLKITHHPETPGILDSVKRAFGLTHKTINLANPKKMDESLENGLFYAEARRPEVRQFISPKTLLVGRRGVVTNVNKTRYQAAQTALTTTGQAPFSKAQALADTERVVVKLLPGNKIRITDTDGNGKVGLLHRSKVRKVKLNPAKPEESVNLSYQYAERVAQRNGLISPQFMVSPATKRVTQDGITRYDQVKAALDAVEARIEALETKGVKIKVQGNGKVRISAPRTGRFAKLNPTRFTMELSRKSTEPWADFITRVLPQAENLANAL